MFTALTLVGFVIYHLFLILIFNHGFLNLASDGHVANLPNFCFAGGTFVLAVLHPFGDTWTTILMLTVVK